MILYAKGVLLFFGMIYSVYIAKELINIAHKLKEY